MGGSTWDGLGRARRRCGKKHKREEGLMGAGEGVRPGSHSQPTLPARGLVGIQDGEVGAV